MFALEWAGQVLHQKTLRLVETFFVVFPKITFLALVFADFAVFDKVRENW